MAREIYSKQAEAYKRNLQTNYTRLDINGLLLIQKYLSRLTTKRIIREGCFWRKSYLLTVCSLRHLYMLCISSFGICESGGENVSRMKVKIM